MEQHTRRNPLSIIVVPEILREKLGADGAQALVDLLNQGMGMTRGEFAAALDQRFERLDQRFSLFEEKFEHRLAEEIGNVREGLGEKISKVGKDAAGSEGRLTRWMFLFWVGQIGVLTGILFAFFR